MNALLPPSFPWWPSGRTDSIVVPFESDAIAFASNVQPDATAAKGFLFVAFVPGFSARPTSGSGSLVRRHVSVSSIFSLLLHCLLMGS